MEYFMKNLNLKCLVLLVALTSAVALRAEDVTVPVEAAKSAEKAVEAVKPLVSRILKSITSNTGKAWDFTKVQPAAILTKWNGHYTLSPILAPTVATIAAVALMYVGYRIATRNSDKNSLRTRN